MHRSALKSFSLLLLLATFGAAQTHSSPHPHKKTATKPSSEGWVVKPQWVHADEDFLASDAMHGRGSGTHDEEITATYLASRLEGFGIEPAGPNGSFVQQAELTAADFPQPRRRRPTPPGATTPPGTPPPSAQNPAPSTAPAPEQPAQAPAAEPAKPPSLHTWNVLGILHGTAVDADKQIVLLSAHLDHLGIGKPVNGDDIYNGADDDASGVTAVLEIARALAAGPRPKRSVMVAFWGSEEKGGVGARYYLNHPTIPASNLVANLEFEMIGRSDSAVKPNELWLTGYERSNLGAELAKHGAFLVADPHPEQRFFERSDNFQLAKDGIVAHTVSSFNPKNPYHVPFDDVAHLDFDHMIQSIQSMIEPVRWLVNSDFRPQWNTGGKP